jgi:putative ubiquitin-RnfH superfamily antitoxin RatB of RatAB toxin-antitoxin module
MAESALQVEVCHASADAPLRIALQVAVGTTIASAVRQALPHIDLTQHRVGIYGKLKTPDTVLRDQDRIEIYRPLLADPKDARRRRAKG